MHTNANAFDSARAALAEYQAHQRAPLPHMVHKLAAALERVLEVTSGQPEPVSADAPDNVLSFPNAWHAQPIRLADRLERAPHIDDDPDARWTAAGPTPTYLAQQAEVERLARIANKIPGRSS